MKFVCLARFFISSGTQNNLMSQNRQLAAIMFTDIVGYTALMGKDEQRAFEILKKNRQIQRPLIEHHNGKLLKEMGDGILASFHTVSDAVYCALEIQNRTKKEGDFQLRIGIHLGEVVFEKNDVFGDGVNIASRIQSIAPEGETVVSESVYRNIANKKGLQVEFLREEMLKNVDTPIKIYRVKMDSSIESGSGQFLHQPTHSNKNGFSGRKKIAGIIMGIVILSAAGIFLYPNIFKKKADRAAQSTTDGERKSIAVLPFTDNSPEKDQEYLGDGIAEEILNVLNTQMKDLKVTGRTSSFSFKGKGMDLKTIGKILNVKSLLEGSVQKLGNKIKVVVRLINADDESIIWTDPYEKELKDIFIIQDEIATKVGEKLKLTFSSNDTSESRTVNPQAIENLLKGNFYFNKGSIKGYRDAVDYYKESISIDSTYAYPHIRLGWAIYRLTLSGKYTTKVGFDSVSKEIEKGLSLEVSASEKESAHKLLAYINLWQYNWNDARAEYEKALAINPKPDVFNAFYQSLVLGKTGDGVSILEKIVDENPVDLSNLRDLAILQSTGRQFVNAKKSCEKILALDSTFSEAYRIRGSVYFAEKKIDSAISDFNKGIALDNPWAPLLTITTLGYIGKKDEAKKLYARVDSMVSGNLPAIARAIIYHSLGDSNKAFEWLDRSYEEKDFWLASLKVDPLWDPLRSDPRFKKILKKMNFPE